MNLCQSGLNTIHTVYTPPPRVTTPLWTDETHNVWRVSNNKYVWILLMPDNDPVCVRKIQTPKPTYLRTSEPDLFIYGGGCLVMRRRLEDQKA